MAPKLPGEGTEALAGPSELGLRIPSSHRVDQGFEIPTEAGVLRDRALPTTARATHPSGAERTAGLGQLPKSTGDGSSGDAGGAMDLSDTSPTQAPGFGGEHETPLPLVQSRQDRYEFPPQRRGGHKKEAKVPILDPLFPNEPLVLGPIALVSTPEAASRVTIDG